MLLAELLPELESDLVVATFRDVAMLESCFRKKSSYVATSEIFFLGKSQSPPDCHIAPAGASPSHKACCLFVLDLRFSQEM